MLRMKRIPLIVTVLFCLGASGPTFCQDVIEEGEGTGVEGGSPQRVWYKNYISVKLHPKWTVENSLLLGLRDVGHQFSFLQIGVGVRYKFNRFWSMRLGYESTLFKRS